MNATDLCAELDRSLGELFACAPQGDYCRIRTPYLYPDGDNIDLFCKADGDVTTVSDLGETNRWLRTQTLSPRRSPKQNALITDVCVTHGVEFYKGMLLGRGRPGDSLAAVASRRPHCAFPTCGSRSVHERWSRSRMKWRMCSLSGH
jgi:hypothetical protein